MPGPSVAFRFGMVGTSAEDFLALTGDPAVLRDARAQLALPERDRHLHINGPIGRVSPGRNLAWSWQHLDSRWQLSQISIELCDGLPSYVEAHLDEWLRDVGRFCPWSSYVKEELASIPES